MKRKLTTILGAFLAIFFQNTLLAQNDYFFPEGTQFDNKIPSPSEFLGYNIGEHYTRHDQIIAYFQELSKLSDKVTFEEIGKTYEGRPLAIATFTSAENHGNIDAIRASRQSVIDPQSPALDSNSSPVIIMFGYSVHGAETSSGEASLLTAYYLAAARSEEVDRYLDEAVIIFDIAQNPDGRDRTANWHNAYKSTPAVSDPLDKEHLEQFPGGRSNHYFTDLNRDWLSVTQKETKPKIDVYHAWYPNIYIDFHEMGGNSTYYFEPTPKSSESPIIPQEIYEFNAVLAKYHAEALDEVGSLYFTKETFDNFSPVYGSTYPDFHGAVGVTFEQGSSRGLLQDTDNGPLEFRFTVKNQLVTGLATFKGALEEKEGLFTLQRNFFKTALDESGKHAAKSYVFGDANDRNLTKKFLELLLTHRVAVYELESDQTIENKSYARGSSFVVPAAQPQFKILHSLFEETPDIKDSVFYGSTSYSVIHGYGLPYSKSTSAVKLGSQITDSQDLIVPSEDLQAPKSTYAYLVSWTDYNASQFLYELLEKGVIVKAAYKPFTSPTTAGDVSFEYGSLVIPVVGQEKNADELYEVISEASKKSNIKFHASNTGFNVKGIDLGSNNIRTIQKPKVALLMGQGINLAESGQVWYLLNEHLKLPVVKLDPSNFSRANFSKYTTIILPGGNYNSFEKETVERLKSWIDQGGTLITFKSASAWAIDNGLSSEKIYTADSATEQTEVKRIDYVSQMEANAPDRISGNILAADIDITNPVGFGLSNRDIFVNIDGGVILAPSANRFSTVVQFKQEPHVNGYISKKNLDNFRNNAYLLTNSLGSGSIVLFADDPTYRKYWHGTDRLLMNAIFFGNQISISSERR